MLAFVTPANAANSNGNYEVKGVPDHLSCGSYSAARQQQGGLAAHDFLVWLGGYVTATNDRLANTYEIAGDTDFDGLRGWLDNFCAANPTRSFAGAADALVTFLYPTRKQHGD